MQEVIIKEVKKSSTRNNELNVTKRNSKTEVFEAEKINKILIWATSGISGVSASDVAMNAHLQFYPGIKTSEIHKVLIQSAVDLISDKNPNYQYVASNLLNYLLRKEVFETKKELPSLLECINRNIKVDLYDSLILNKYSHDEISKCDSYIKHERDYDLTYAGLQQLIDKYLVKDRSTGKSYETPQFCFMMISMTVFADYDKSTRMDFVKELYDMISEHKISLPTPIMAGIRTPNRQFSSCTLIEVGDSLDSIFHGNVAIGQYVAKRAGIGINAGQIRALGSKVRNGEVVHTGVIPFFKMFQSTLHSCSQGGIRKGSATLYFPWWHKEIEDVLVLKNNKGTDDNRVRHMDYGIQFEKTFYSRFISNGDIALFSPSDVPGLYDVFGFPEFEELYLKYEADKKIPKKFVKARDLMNSFAQERIGTGRMYVMNIDNANTNSPFIERLKMSNLCVEIVLPTAPIENIYDIDNKKETEQYSDAEIALCTLAAFNLGNIKSWSELHRVAEYIVRILEYVIENQDYPINAAKKMLKRRSVGVGVTNFAYWLAKQGVKYSDKEALFYVDELFENIQYSLLKASNKLSQEFGKCEWYDKTTYSKGVLPIDRYNKNVDELVKRDYSCDWETLRSDIEKFGLRNSVLTAIMPAESSAVVQNATNGIEPIRSLVITKKSKSGLVKQVAPECIKLKNKYELAYEMPDNRGYTNICAIIQKWIDQSISANHYYQYSSDGISIGGVIKDVLYAYKYGLKTLYYANTDDKKTDDISQMGMDGCESGACSI
jgi:ribonucleoside-diphosphate reductase alpha chain